MITVQTFFPMFFEEFPEIFQLCFGEFCIRSLNQKYLISDFQKSSMKQIQEFLTKEELSFST